jgi:ADP-ribose pyrophosphatase
MPLEPYRVIGTRVALDSKYVKVREDVFVHGGKQGVHSVIDLPKAAAVVPVLDDGRLLLIRQYRHCVGRVLWELPAGRVDPSETVEEAARRELEEETGFTASEWRALGSFYPLAGLSNHEAFVFEARGLTPGPKRLDEFEDIEAAPLTPAEVLEKLAAGEIPDGFCQLGLLHWLRHRGVVAAPGAVEDQIRRPPTG